MRVSFKRIQDLCDMCGLEVCRHEWLGDRKSPYYNYTLSKNKEVLLSQVELKTIHRFILKNYIYKDYEDILK